MNKEEKCNLKIKKILCKRHRVLFFLIGKKAEKNVCTKMHLFGMNFN